MGAKEGTGIPPSLRLGPGLKPPCRLERNRTHNLLRYREAPMNPPTSRLAAAVGKKIMEVASGGPVQEALLLCKELHSSGIHGTPSFLPSLLKTCTSPQSLFFALQLHCSILKAGLISDPVTMNSLLSMYSKHSMIDSARLLFDTAPLRDTVTWNSMINCYIRNGYTFESMKTVREMHSAGCTLKPELTAAVVSVCGQVQNSNFGRAIHAHAIQNGAFEACVLLPTALVDMYSRCQDLDAALKVFSLMPERNVISWTAMITGLMRNGVYDVSLEMFREMGVKGMKPNRATLVTVLPACSALGALKHGKEIHCYVYRHGFQLEPKIVGALIDLYGRCKGVVHLASLVFERAEERDVVIWSSMLANSTRNSDYVGTMKLLHQMKKDGIRPNSVTMLAVIAACIGLSSIGYGQGVHGCILKSGLISDAFVRNSLIDLYAKIGCLDSSIRIFSEMPAKDSISYSSMIAGYGLHGHGYDALRLFNEMLEMGVEVDGIAILAVLSACNHSGLVGEAKKLFDSWGRSSGILSSLEHYACYIDLLGKSGKLEDACDVIRNMPMKPSPRILSSLVSACRAHGRFEVAEQLAFWLINSEPENAANYTLLSMIHAEAGDWSKAEDIRRAMRERGLMKKSYGSSQIQTGAEFCCSSVI